MECTKKDIRGNNEFKDVKAIDYSKKVLYQLHGKHNLYLFRWCIYLRLRENVSNVTLARLEVEVAKLNE